MNKLTEMINLKAAVAGAAVLTTLSTLIPNTAQALPFGSKRKPDAFGIEFDLSDSSDGKGAIRGFIVKGESIGVEEPDTGNTDFIDLTAAKSDTAFVLQVMEKDLSSVLATNKLVFENSFDDIFDDDFSEDELIYEFSFQVTDIMLTNTAENLLSDGDKNAIKDSEGGIVKWFVPKNFTFQGQSFDLFVNGDATLLPDENNLASIFTVAANNEIDEIAFPSQYVNFGDNFSLNSREIVFETSSQTGTQKTTPESDNTTSLLALGIIGGLVYQKRKLR